MEYLKLRLRRAAWSCVFFYLTSRSLHSKWIFKMIHCRRVHNKPYIAYTVNFSLDQIINFLFKHNKAFHLGHLHLLTAVRHKYMYVFFMCFRIPKSLSIRLKLILRAPGSMIPFHGANSRKNCKFRESVSQT